MVFWSTTATHIAAKLDALRLAEQKLLSIAVGNNNSNHHHHHHNPLPPPPPEQQQQQQQQPPPIPCSIATSDTNIPASALMPPSNKRRCSIADCGDDGDVLPTQAQPPLVGDRESTPTTSSRRYRPENDVMYVMHSIDVTSDRARTTEPNTNSNSSTAQHPEPALVLLHGYANGAAYFYRNLVGLSQYFGRIHALDLLGWGLSSRPNFPQALSSSLAAAKRRGEHDATGKNHNHDPITAAEDFFVESIEAWRRAKRIDRMILAGHSLGGYLSVAYCERYPQHVERLILISPVGVPPETMEDQERRRTQLLSSSWRNRVFYALYAKLFDWLSPGDLLRTVSETRSRGWVERYIQRRLPAIQDIYEQQTLADYLHHNNTLPGSGEYCLPVLLKPSIYGRRPLQHRIPHLKVRSCTFLYGDADWMDASAACRVEQICRDRTTVSPQQQPHQQPVTKSPSASSTTNSNTSPSTAAAATTTTAPPVIDVYQVSQSGHLLLLENSVEFNHGIAMAAGLDVSSSSLPGGREGDTGLRLPTRIAAPAQ